MNALEMYEDRFEVLDSLEPVVERLMEHHKSQRKLWFSSDFLPASEKNTEEDERKLIELRKRAKTLPDAVRVTLDLNLRTEEGLPHFHRLISVAAKYGSALGRWNNLWTAEEDRHGNIIRDYVREARVFNFRSAEAQQFEYIYAGFNPVWVGRSPYETFVYTTLQELATKISHDRTGKMAGNYEPLLEEILKKVAGDEARHYVFYRDFFKAILEVDPDNALCAAAKIMPHIDMPGISAPRFKEYLEVIARLGIYTLRHYKEVVEAIIRHWDISALRNLKTEAARAQEIILGLPARLEALVERIEHSMKNQKTFSFDVVYQREFILDGSIQKP